jgi:uncharacterized RDD family membrane protein YckC
MMGGATRLEADDVLTAGVLGRRVIAWLVDVVIVGVICAVLWTVLFTFGVLTLGLGLPLLGLVPLVPFLYHFLFLASPFAATPGMAALGLTVRRDEDLGPPLAVQALVAALGYILTWATSGLLFLVALFTVRNRTLHDLVSGLVVVRRRALTPAFGSWNMHADR